MKTTLCRGALALALLGGVALISAPAQAGSLQAGSLQDEGDFGGTWTPIAPSDHYHQRYVGPVFGSFYYGPPFYDYYDPGFTPITGRRSLTRPTFTTTGRRSSVGLASGCRSASTKEGCDANPSLVHVSA